MDQPPTVQGNLHRNPITAFKIYLQMTQKNTQLFHTLSEIEDANTRRWKVTREAINLHCKYINVCLYGAGREKHQERKEVGEEREGKIWKSRWGDDRLWTGEPYHSRQQNVPRHFLALNWLKVLSTLFIFCFWNNCCICRTVASRFEIGDKVVSGALSPPNAGGCVTTHRRSPLQREWRGGGKKRESSSFKTMSLLSQRCHPWQSPSLGWGNAIKRPFYNNQFQQGRSNLEHGRNGPGTGRRSHCSNRP